MGISAQATRMAIPSTGMASGPPKRPEKLIWQRTTRPADSRAKSERIGEGEWDANTLFGEYVGYL